MFDRTWCITRAESSKPGVLWLLGTIQRMKWGSVWFKVVNLERKKVRNIFAKIFKLTGRRAGLGTQRRRS